MAELAVEELQKLKAQLSPVTGRPASQRKTFFFFCVICRDFKQGSAKNSIEIGGWCCAHHPTPAKEDDNG